MSISAIISDKTINDIVDAFLTNQAFKNKFIQKINLISEDGKIDRRDMPHIVAVLFLLYCNQDVFINLKRSINDESLRKVFKLFLWKLFNEIDTFSALSDEDKELCESLIDTSVELLFIKLPAIKGHFQKYLCCCTKISDNIGADIASLENKIAENKRNRH